MDKDNLWSRRSNSSKLSLTTPQTSSDSPARTFSSSRRFGDNTSSHAAGKSNPFNNLSPAALPSPTTGTVSASSAFGLGSGAFASFGSSTKTPKSPGNALDFGAIVGGGKTPTAEKSKEGLLGLIGKSDRAGKGDAGLETTGPVKAAQSGLDTPPSQVANKTALLTVDDLDRPLACNWVLWYRPPIAKSAAQQDYDKTIHPKGNVGTLREFKSVVGAVSKPSRLPIVSEYAFFKEGVRPVWEDDENKSGGKYLIRFQKNIGKYSIADYKWRDMVFALVGDLWEELRDDVCGAVISMRNGEDHMSLWVRREDAKIKTILENILELGPTDLATPGVAYKKHSPTKDRDTHPPQQSHHRNGRNVDEEKVAA